MGKNRQRYSKSTVDNSRSGKSAKSKVEAAPASGGNNRSKIVWKWLYAERQGLLWVLSCAVLGSLLGFGIGTGHLTGSASRSVSAWRVALGSRIRATEAYKFVTMRLLPSSFSLGNNNPQAGQQQQKLLDNDLRRESYHTRVFAVLRESIVREHGGYVHPDLGFLVPAPCGAARGVGMVRSGYHECQTRCIPGISTEKLDHKTNPNPIHSHVTSDPIYRQEEVLIHLPLSYQMTRYVAIQTLSSIIPTEILQKTPLDDLDDAALLTLLLAHERGLTLASRWLPYISSLPKEPSCGYSVKLRSRYLDSIAAMSDELDLEVQGWPTELIKASRYADRIVQALTRDYGSYLTTPAGITVQGNLQWALCQVASRATAGSEKHGSLRLLPLLDQLNHDSTGGSLVELTGTERLEDGDFIDATEQESGAFVVRALRHGRRRALKVGQELVINYNVPQFTPLDWFISVGFVPPERWKPWVKIDPVLPRVRRDGPFDVEEEMKSKIWDNSLN
eukprot:CAMPEP_0178905502 /NCGR_PEP_ID=MMETSP0786-20121207/6310_1 /TAXON_ID=186022 /ORGANISM="Thalassionema frauenfeldii, Strain CCMP 1798" /LENGTH=503 /DNA_ID=CAMNT_0020577115 /DNA_START=51 /DNA_END=1562 /DNA_ORIENTATION=-